MAMTAVVNGAVTLCDGIKLLQSLNSTFRNDEHRFLHVLSALNRLAILSLNMGATIGSATKIDPSKVSVLRSSELLTRVADIPIRFMEFVEDLEGQPTSSVLDFYTKVLIAPIAGIIKTACEVEISREQGYIKEFEEMGDKAKRPIFEYDPREEVTKIVGYEPVNPDACREEIKSLQTQANIAGALRVTQDIGVKNILATPRKLYEELHLYLRFRRTLSARLGAAPAAAAIAARPAIDLLALGYIPDPLHADPVFSRYTCAISRVPIRDPVGDPNGVTLYERDYIVRWLRVHPTSPTTRNPLRPSELVEKPALKTLIDNRLRFHQTHLDDYLNNSGIFNVAAPVDPVLQVRVDAENPRS